jgi:hypothetical protein
MYLGFPKQKFEAKLPSRIGGRTVGEDKAAARVHLA